ncbi:hypothetical protein J2D73_10515 [Acetobacter sacchari]|uniref:L-lactate permease n=1 Tax=Acetobacter sacchari TaxID=2661687 RepID=A0ABS3LWD0_9PROT|nr:hypothetical protein [Acetobacter sacchari]
MIRFPFFQNSVVVRIVVVLSWSGLLEPMEACVGTLSPVFLRAVDHVTDYRFARPALVPAVGRCCRRTGLIIGSGVPPKAGNNLIVGQIHEPGGELLLRMVPLVLVATAVGHLFGASVG